MDKVEKVGTLHTSKLTTEEAEQKKGGGSRAHQNTDHSRRVWELQGFDRLG